MEELLNSEGNWDVLFEPMNFFNKYRSVKYVVCWWWSQLAEDVLCAGIILPSVQLVRPTLIA